MQINISKITAIISGIILLVIIAISVWLLISEKQKSRKLQQDLDTARTPIEIIATDKSAHDTERKEQEKKDEEHEEEIQYLTNIINKQYERLTRYKDSVNLLRPVVGTDAQQRELSRFASKSPGGGD